MGPGSRTDIGPARKIWEGPRPSAWGLASLTLSHDFAHSPEKWQRPLRHAGDARAPRLLLQVDAERGIDRVLERYWQCRPPQVPKAFSQMRYFSASPLGDALVGYTIWAKDLKLPTTCSAGSVSIRG